MARNAAAYTVLVADDCSDDVLLLKRAFQESDQARFLEVLSTGQQVLEYFEGKGRFSDRANHPIPDVLILDLKMPIKGGLEVLTWLHGHGIPLPKRVAILTGFTRPCDVLRSHELGAHFIAQKEADYRPLVHRLDSAMSDFGASVCQSAAGVGRLD